MPVALLNQTLSSAATTILIASSSPTSTSDLLAASQTPQWDAVAVYGFVFGLLAVILAIPGTYLAILALKRHRNIAPAQDLASAVELDIERQTSALEDERVEAVGIELVREGTHKTHSGREL